MWGIVLFLFLLYLFALIYDSSLHWGIEVWFIFYFYINDFIKLSSLLQKEIIRHIFYVSNNKSTIWLSEANIAEVIRFINGKNNKTVKEIKEMKLKKENTIIIF